MEVIVIGKPAINVYLPLQEFPSEGDLFFINNKNESVGNVAATSACILAKWGINAHFSGVVGNDSYAEKIREIFKNNHVEAKYMETNYSSGTSVNYITLNTKTGVTTKILYNDNNAQLTKYKYDFNPGFAILDGTDLAGALALLNNNGSNCKTIFYARRGDKDTISLAKKCSYVVCTQTFAENLTHEVADGSAEGYVNLYQKIVDASGNSNYIVILNNHKILYAVDGAVKMLPQMKINIADQSSFDSVFTGSLAFALIKEIGLDDAIKFANTAAAISLTRIGEEAAIPDLNEVLSNSGLKEKFGFKEEARNTVAQAQEVTPIRVNNQMNNGTFKENEQVPVENVNNEVALVQKTVVSTPQNVVNEIPQNVAMTQNEMNAFDVSSFQTTNQNAQTPTQVQVNPQPVETNIFDKYNG